MIRCPSCSAENPDRGRFCSSCAAPLAAASPDSMTPTVATAVSLVRETSSSDVDEGRFLPGTLVGGRYRIVALLGKGGMGEVYRATDMRLGQAVALKFLPEAAVRDGHALARLHNEVRIARQISHPNVCRVYDIGEVDGAPFLTMEYIDGEDLASLLRRIGRLPSDKALDIARRLCAGLAAAHEKGVLHRDLKPANIMIDGRGEVLITDFGLAAVAGGVEAAEIRHGTPAYMSPEQLAGREVTVKSDIYGLGLVLYEIFAGKRAFEASSLAELLRMQEESSPVSLATVVRDLDPAVEQAILRCLAPDPRRRPQSALAVAAALPGGDPLAAAMAAGETPSPEMVAAAGTTEGARPAVGVLLLVLSVMGLFGAAVLGPRVNLISRTPFENPPEALAAMARDTVRRLGYAARPADTAYDFDYDSRYLEYMKGHYPAARRWSHLAAGSPAPVVFWYRQSPAPLDPKERLYAGFDYPAMDLPGMVRLRLDMQGRLQSLDAVPGEADEAGAVPARAPDWKALFEAAGLDISRFAEAPPQWVPGAACDARAAWTGTFPGAPEITARVEAAAFQGRPVGFRILGPWAGQEGHAGAHEHHTTDNSDVLVVLALAAIFVTACLLARRNFRLNRGDRRGAARLGFCFLALSLLELVLGMSHVEGVAERNLLIEAAARALWSAALVWILYMALEPYVRSRWPQTLVAWTRVLGGRLRDPLVGLHVLAGVFVGVVWQLLLSGLLLGLQKAGDSPNSISLQNLLGVRHVARHVIGHMTGGIEFALGAFFVIFLLRLLLRKGWAAGVAFVVLITALKLGSENGAPWFAIPVVVAIYTSLVLVLLRYGLVALVTAVLAADFLAMSPLTLDTSQWYFGYSLAVLLTVAALGMYGFHTALGGRSLLRDETLAK